MVEIGQHANKHDSNAYRGMLPRVPQMGLEIAAEIRHRLAEAVHASASERVVSSRYLSEIIQFANLECPIRPRCAQNIKDPACSIHHSLTAPRPRFAELLYSSSPRSLAASLAESLPRYRCRRNGSARAL